MKKVTFPESEKDVAKINKHKSEKQQTSDNGLYNINSIHNPDGQSPFKTTATPIK